MIVVEDGHWLPQLPQLTHYQITTELGFLKNPDQIHSFPVGVLNQTQGCLPIQPNHRLPLCTIQTSLAVAVPVSVNNLSLLSHKTMPSRMSRVAHATRGRDMAPGSIGGWKLWWCTDKQLGINWDNIVTTICIHLMHFSTSNLSILWVHPNKYVNK